MLLIKWASLKSCFRAVTKERVYTEIKKKKNTTSKISVAVTSDNLLKK